MVMDEGIYMQIGGLIAKCTQGVRDLQVNFYEVLLFFVHARR
jgi:hypothetical protein